MLNLVGNWGPKYRVACILLAYIKIFSELCYEIVYINILLITETQCVLVVRYFKIMRKRLTTIF